MTTYQMNPERSSLSFRGVFFSHAQACWNPLQLQLILILILTPPVTTVKSAIACNHVAVSDSASLVLEPVVHAQL
jgi:hypothetical protein